ncbi:MAG: hypothetical protein IPP90_23745 [Gemmatimonadaceae bacterium]|nr:hypothetical protein [Gemmatimonadaceae bacterium]
MSAIHWHSPDGITCIPSGQCATYLAPAPLGLVPMDDELRDALRALGLRTVGMLASLAPGDIERRWGAEGLTAWRLAHGDDTRRPGLVRVEATRSTSVELPAAVESTAPVLFVLQRAVDRLVRELVNDGRSAAAVSVTLILDAGRQATEDVGTDGHDHDAFPGNIERCADGGGRAPASAPHRQCCGHRAKPLRPHRCCPFHNAASRAKCVRRDRWRDSSPCSINVARCLSVG